MTFSDADGPGPYRYAVGIQPPLHGDVTSGGGNDLTYTPDAGFTGTDSFTWQVNDGLADSNVATVTVRVGDPPPNGLVAYWPFDESSGLSAFDASGKGWTGTLVNGTQWAAGKRGQALAFDGTNDEMHTGDLPTSSAMTWVFWMNPANISSTRGILDKYTSGANREWRIYLMAGGELRLSIANGTKGYQERNTSKFKPALNVWTHVAVVYNAGAFNVYKNGVLVSTSGNFTSPYTSIQNTTTKVRIGLRQAGGEHFNGKLDEVRIYNRALSVAEILALKDY